MDMKSYIEQILIDEQELEAVIVEIFKTGSQLWRNDPHDLDYVIVCENYHQRRRKHIVTIEDVVYDIIIMSTEAVHAQLSFTDNHYIHYNIKLYNYNFLIKDIVYGGYEHNWDFFAHKEEYLAYLKEHHSKYEGRYKQPWRAGKTLVHYYIVLKMYENESTEITTSMLADINQLYIRNEDCMPIINWIAEEINKI